MTRTGTVILGTLVGAACARGAPPLTPVEAVTSSLRAVASAQEAYYADHGTYTADLDALRRYPGCHIQLDVTITIHEGTSRGWAASGFHPQFPERSCVQWVSRPGGASVPLTRRESRRGDALPGGVVCDSAAVPHR